MLRNIKALTFDLFGTVFDWRGSITAHANAVGIDGEKFAVAWARKYADYVHGGQPWTRLSYVLHGAGRDLWEEFGLPFPTPVNFTCKWETLSPFSDAGIGIRMLREKRVCVALSNAETEMVQTLSASSDVEFDRIIGNELIQAYKPDRRVYRTAAVVLDLEPSEIMMVAAHLFDLRAAKANGFQTAFIRREGEETGDPALAAYVDLIADDLIDLARQLN